MNPHDGMTSVERGFGTWSPLTASFDRTHWQVWYLSDPLRTKPDKPLKLAVRLTGMVYEPSMVALSPLPDLIRHFIRLAHHDILVLHA